jgi:hypothetical protein
MLTLPVLSVRNGWAWGLIHGPLTINGGSRRTGSGSESTPSAAPAVS